MNSLIFSDKDALANGAADIVADAIAHHDNLALGLAGGSTPRATHEVLATREIDWSGVTAWMTDERWVAPTDTESNQAMVRESLVTAVGGTFLAPDTTLGNPATAAKRYSNMLIPAITQPGQHSVVMLGLGTDGHTASLFPDTQALTIEGVAYVANFVPQLDTWRLTATFGLLGSAHTVLFLVSGEDKAAMVAKIAAGESFPAARVTAQDTVTWLLDEAAASQL